MTTSALTIDILLTEKTFLERHACSCGQLMRFVGMEPHALLARSNVFTFECLCGETYVETRVVH
jgi:hypothetical protein